MSVYSVYGIRISKSYLIDWTIHVVEFFFVFLNGYYLIFDRPTIIKELNAGFLSLLLCHRIIALYVYKLTGCGCGFGFFGLSDHLVSGIVGFLMIANAYLFKVKLSSANPNS